MNEGTKAAKREFIHWRIENYIQQAIPKEYELVEVFSNHPSSIDFEFHYSTKTINGESFRLIFSGPIFGIHMYLKFHFEKQISSSRLLILESQMKRFTDITYVDFVQFASDVDTLISTQMI